MSSLLEWDESTSLVDRLLEEQRHLTAVDEFSAYHESDSADGRRYEALIPSALPGEAEQFAFRVDLDACTGCKACVTACHSLNGLEESETWRKVGLIEGTQPLQLVDDLQTTTAATSVAGGADLSSSPAAVEPIPPVVAPPAELVHQQTVTTACHHCEEPACLAGCPVRAYEKDATTGIVRHLDDQCIGCRYCQLMCPYDVPTYSERLGIVRKCDMCHDRLVEGEAPACVQGCPNEAISIAVVPVSSAAPDVSPRLLDTSAGSIPESRLTRPTTRYVSARPTAGGIDPIRLRSPRASEGHTPLAIMLVLTQAAIGMVTFDVLCLVAATLFADGLVWSRWVLTAATAIGLLGLAASIVHLGRPQWAFRAILGIRTSWMSREILVLGGFAGLLVGACLSSWVGWGVGSGRLPGAFDSFAKLGPGLQVATALVGWLGAYCSVQIYAVTGRPLWRFHRTAFRFGAGAAAAGLSAASIGLLMITEPDMPIEGLATSMTLASSAQGVVVSALALGLMALTVVRLRFESGWSFQADAEEEAIALGRSASLLGGELARWAALRRGSLIAAGLVLPSLQLVSMAAGVSTGFQIALAACILLAGIASDLVERSLFFRSEAMPSMPGVE